MDLKVCQSKYSDVNLMCLNQPSANAADNQLNCVSCARDRDRFRTHTSTQALQILSVLEPKLKLGMDLLQTCSCGRNLYMHISMAFHETLYTIHVSINDLHGQPSYAMLRHATDIVPHVVEVATV